MRVLGGFQQLETLSIPSSEVSDKGVTNLLNLKRLRCLKLYGLDVTSEGVKKITSLPSLQELILYDCNIAESELEEAVQGRPALKANIYYVQRTPPTPKVSDME